MFATIFIKSHWFENNLCMSVLKTTLLKGMYFMCDTRLIPFFAKLNSMEVHKRLFPWNIYRLLHQGDPHHISGLYQCDIPLLTIIITHYSVVRSSLKIILFSGIPPLANQTFPRSQTKHKQIPHVVNISKSIKTFFYLPITSVKRVL